MAQRNNLELNMSDDGLPKAPSTPMGGQLVVFDRLAMIGPMPVADEEADDFLAMPEMSEEEMLDLVGRDLFGARGADEIAKNLTPPAPMVHTVIPPVTPPAASAPVNTNTNTNNFNFTNININKGNNNIAQSAPVVHPITPTAAVNALAVYNNNNNDLNRGKILNRGKHINLSNYNNKRNKRNNNKNNNKNNNENNINNILKIEPMEVGGVLALRQPQPLRQMAEAMEMYKFGTKVSKFWDYEDLEDVWELFDGIVWGYDVEHEWWRIRWEDEMESDHTEQEMIKIFMDMAERDRKRAAAEERARKRKRNRL